MTPRLRALVLAAGHGMRLRPLTDTIPKPLLPVLGQPILAHTLRCLAAVGCEAAAVNLHHHGEQIRRCLGERLDGLPLTYSDEPRLLGTLGALQPLREFFAGAEVVLIVNGDSLCRWPLAALVRRHLERGHAATLLLASRADPAEFGGGVAVGRGGAILSLRPDASSPGTAAAALTSPAPLTPLIPVNNANVAAARRVFGGAHALSPHLLERLPPGPAPGAAADIVRDLYEPLLAAEPGCLGSLSMARRWHDLGTPRRFLAASLDWVAASGHGVARSWISSAATVSRRAVLRHCSIEADCRVEAGCVIEGSVLLPGAVVGSGCEVRDSILGPGAELPPGSRVDGHLVPGGGREAVAF